LPKVSVVVPSFNQAAFVERTLLSILNQDYPDLELIVIDGGSTDGTFEVLERYRKYIAYFHAGPDNGQSDALNHGFSKATGEIVAWMNSDDVYLPGAIHAAVEAFEAAPSASVVYGDWWGIDGNDEVLEIFHAFDFSVGHFLYEGFHLNSQAMFWRREAHQRFGQFDVNLHRTMDYDLILRLGLNEGERRFVRLPRPLACFRRHPDQKTTGPAMSQPVLDEHRAIALKHGLSSKYSLSGKALRLLYRFRRAWWYLKRDGLDFTVMRIRGNR
jgi:glycosyltransferase involved in cell wall biosynthesis